ncbi:MAG: PadR family transcriptional regulator [Acidimicrobiales bacterium]
MRHTHDFHEAGPFRFGRDTGAGFDGPPFGGPAFGGPPFGGRGGFGRGGRGRVRRGQIRTALLALLEDEPMHGYEMIRQIDERSGGSWKPSPGAVYPTLAQLTDEGLVTATDDGGKRVFALTDEGRTLVATFGDDDREPWTAEGGHPGFELRGQMHQLGLAIRGVAAAGSPAQLEQAKAILTDARRKLYALLAEEPEEAGTEPPASR